MNKQISNIFKRIFAKEEYAADILLDDAVISKLSQYWNQIPPNMHNFEEDLINQCELNNMNILHLIEVLSQDRELRAACGNYILIFWLVSQLFDLMNISYTQHFKEKRKVVNNFVKNYQFERSSLQEFVQKCFSMAQVKPQKSFEEICKYLVSKKKNGEVMQIFSLPDIEQTSYEKNIQENFHDLISDYSRFPKNTLLSSIQKAIIISFLSLYKEELQNNLQAKQFEQTKFSFDQISELLTAEYRTLSQSMKKALKIIKQSSDKSSLYNALKALKAIILPIDVFELQRLILKTEQSKKMIQDKDIIFILGNTGSGKSTNILKFLGYTLTLAKYKGLNTLVPIEKIEKEHQTFLTSPEGKSCTRYINAVKVPDKMYKQTYSIKKRKIVICDSPGFGDSAGVEVDIANCVGMINALKNARSVRVMVILAYQSLIADRSKGLLQIAQICSNLFHEVANIVQSLVVYFNKVPKDMITQMPAIIESKMNFLNSQSKINQKLKLFLQIIHSQSLFQTHFLYPSQTTTYINQFQELIKLTPITQVKQNFRYDFAISTKQTINNFISFQSGKVRQQFDKEKYQSASLHIRLLISLQKILIHHQNIDLTIQTLTKYISSKSQQELDFIEKGFKQIVQGCYSQNINVPIKSSMKKIKSIQDNLSILDEINMVKYSKIDQLILITRLNILEKCKKINEISTSDTFSKSVLYFAQNFDSTIKNLVIRDLGERYNFQFNKVHAITNQQINLIDQLQLSFKKGNILEIEKLSEQNTLQILQKQEGMRDSIDRIRMLFKILLPLKLESNNKYFQTFIEFQAQLKRHLQQCLQYLRNNFMNQGNFSKEKIKIGVKKTLIIDQICKMKCFPKDYDGQAQRQRLQRQLRKKCQQYMRKLQILQFQFHEQNSISVLHQKAHKDLKKKKDQIQGLLNIIQQNKQLKGDFSQIKRNLSQKLNDNIKTVKDSMVSLKSSADVNIQKILSNLKKAIKIILNSAELLEENNKTIEITQIQNQLIEIIEEQKRQMKKIDTNLNRITQGTLKNIQKIYNNLESYSKMCEFGEKIKSCIETLYQQFYQIVSRPYKNILQKDIKAFKQGNQYSFIRNILPRLNNFAMYSSSIYQFYSHQEYISLSKLQEEILQTLSKIFRRVKHQIEEILERNEDNVDNLSKLLRIFTDLKEKQHAQEYISKHLDFQASEYCTKIFTYLGDIYSQMEAQLKSDRISKDYQNLLKRCRQYSNIRGYSQLVDCNFKDVQQTITKQIINSKQSKYDKAKEAIWGKAPDSIQWNTVIDLYKETNIKPTIVKFLQITQDEGIRKLNQYNRLFSMEFPQFLNNRQNTIEFLECVHQILKLQVKLNTLYADNKDNIKISKKMVEQKVGSNLLSTFVDQGKNIYNQITNYQLYGIQKKLSTLNILEDIIDKIGIEKQKQSSIIKNLIIKFEEKIQSNKIGIEKQNQSSIIKNLIIKFEEKIESNTPTIFDKTKIAIRLQKMYELINKQVQEKYLVSEQQLQIDEGFSKYYRNLKQSQSDVIKQRRLQIRERTIKHFEILQEKYKIAYNNSILEAQQIQLQIKDKCKHLPLQISKQIQPNFKSIKLKLQNEDNLKIKQSIDLIYLSNNLSSFDRFITNYEQLKQKNKTALMNKLIDNFRKTLTQKINNIFNLSDDIKILEEYIQPILRKIRMNQTNQIIKTIVQKVFQILVNRCKKTTDIELQKIKKYFESESHKNSSQTNSCKQVISLLFTVSKALYQLEKIDFLPQVSQSLKEINDIFERKAQRIVINRQFLKTLNNNKTKENIQQYFHELEELNRITDEIKLNLKRYSSIINIQIQQSNPLEKKKNEIRIQIINLLAILEDFRFISDENRNKTSRERQSILQEIDSLYLSLTNVRDLFINLLDDKTKKTYIRLSQILKDKLRALNQQAETQLSQLFAKGYLTSYSFKIDLILDILSIMKNKKLSFVQAQIIEIYKNQLEKKIYQNYDGLKNVTKESFLSLIQAYENIKNKRKKHKQLKIDQINKLKLQKEEELLTAKTAIQNKFQQKIQKEIDDNQKQLLKKQSATQINSLQNGILIKLSQMVKEVQVKNDHIVQEAQQKFNKNIKLFCQNLILYYSIIQQLTFSREKQVYNFDSLIQNIAQSKKGPIFIKEIQNILQDSPIDTYKRGKKIMMQYKIFYNFVVNVRKQKTSKNGIDYTVNNLQKLIDSNKENLAKKQKEVILKFYGIFHDKYESYKNSYSTNPNESTIIMVVNQCKDLGKQIEKDFYRNKNPQRGNKIQLLAGIFALWAIMQSEEFEGEVEWNVEPHPTQIVTLMLLIGIVHQKEILDNRLAQVGTGEGKSIVLAGLSSYLALVGFKVRCSCYSAYLSKRDEQNFKGLFERLGIEREIKYGTFNELCQDILNSDGVSFKAEVEKMLLQQPKSISQRFFNFFGKNILKFNRGASEIQSNQTILIIDEVDVFFDSNFFGSLYWPAIKLNSPTVKEFLEFIWKSVKAKKQQIEIKDLKQSQVFKRLVSQYPTIQKLLQNQLHGMIAGSLAYKHDYILIDNKLLYKENDTISPFINYGYKTVFANIYEYERGNISKINYDNALVISLIIAEFSYAQLPNYFHRILGVTGTLEVLPRYKKDVLKQRYSIEEQFIIPSAFGINNKRTIEYKIVKQQDLTNQIVKRLGQIKEDRPIILFFKKSDDLSNFFCSQQYRPFKRRTFNLTEQHEAAVRDSRISQAVHREIITLMTSSFGRGTDFMLYDDKINQAGGLHVIQCFLSLQESEEVQIKGRTARQSSKGSYQCILSSSWLEQLDIKEQAIGPETPSEQIHKELLKSREKKADTLADTTLQLVQQARTKHKQVEEVYYSKSLRQNELIDYIGRINRYPQVTKLKIRTVLGIDGTGSMGNGLKKVCEVCSKAFQETYAVLEQHKLKVSVEIKIMIYRNYNSRFNQILESTAFENKPDNLKVFLSKVTASGGWGNEAIEVLLQAINKEEKVDQVIIIADAAPNEESEVTQKRQQQGESYWIKHGFHPTTFNKQLDQFMKVKKSPIHCFYIKPPNKNVITVEKSFKQISRKTQGTSQLFTPHHRNASKDLTAFLVQNTLRAIQKSNGQKNLIQTYRKMFL